MFSNHKWKTVKDYREYGKFSDKVDSCSGTLTLSKLLGVIDFKLHTLVVNVDNTVVLTINGVSPKDFCELDNFLSNYNWGKIENNPKCRLNDSFDLDQLLSSTIESLDTKTFGKQKIFITV